MAAEFDNYAATGYNKLLQDPLRDRFGGERFFFERKLWLLRTLCEQYGKRTQSTRWLDVGCGEGTLLHIGGIHFAKVAGCDVSSGMIGDDKGLDVRQQPSARKIPFPDQSFDLVTAVCVYHHVELLDRPFLTAEIRRVLTSRGLFCIIEHNPLNPVARLIVRRSPIDIHAHLLSAEACRDLGRAAHLQVLMTRYFLYLPEFLYSRLPALEELLAPVPLGGQYAVLFRNS
jgi:SAM-dependent methyltransferase